MTFLSREGVKKPKELLEEKKWKRSHMPLTTTRSEKLSKWVGRWKWKKVGEIGRERVGTKKKKKEAMVQRKKEKKKRRNLGREWQAAAKHLAATRLSDWRQIKKWIKDSSLSHAWTPAFHEAMAPELYKPQCVTKTSISNNAVIVAALQLLQTFLVAPSGSDSRDWHDAISFFFFFFFFVVCTLPAHGRSTQTRD